MPRPLLKKVCVSLVVSALFVAIVLVAFARPSWFGNRRAIHAVPAGGNITLDGEPLAEARILFMPLDSSGAPACSLTDEHGAFQLVTWLDPKSPLSGAAPGKYAVAVSKEATNGTVARPVAHLLLRTTPLTPPKYADPKTSILRATVVRDGRNDFRLRLTSHDDEKIEHALQDSP